MSISEIYSEKSAENPILNHVKSFVEQCPFGSIARVGGGKDEFNWALIAGSPKSVSFAGKRKSNQLMEIEEKCEEVGIEFNFGELPDECDLVIVTGKGSLPEVKRYIITTQDIEIPSNFSLEREVEDLRIYRNTDNVDYSI